MCPSIVSFIESYCDVYLESPLLEVLQYCMYAWICPEWMKWWPKKSRIGPKLPENACITCKTGGYMPVSDGQLALVMAKVTTTNHCGQNNMYVPVEWWMEQYKSWTAPDSIAFPLPPPPPLPLPPSHLPHPPLPTTTTVSPAKRSTATESSSPRIRLPWG